MLSISSLTMHRFSCIAPARCSKSLADPSNRTQQSHYKTTACHVTALFPHQKACATLLFQGNLCATTKEGGRRYQLSLFCMVCRKPSLCMGPCSATSAQKCTSPAWRTSTMSTSPNCHVKDNAKGAYETQQTSNGRVPTGYDGRKMQDGKQKPGSIALYDTD